MYHKVYIGLWFLNILDYFMQTIWTLIYAPFSCSQSIFVTFCDEIDSWSLRRGRQTLADSGANRHLWWFVRKCQSVDLPG